MNMEGPGDAQRRSFLQGAGLALATFVLAGLPVRAAPAEPRRKIGIVGSGRIGGTLGELWLKAGHEAMFSSRDLEHDKALAAKLGPRARAGTPREAAAFGDVLLFAVPYRALPELGKDLGDLLRGKVVIDASNPITGRDGDVAVWAREKGAGLASAELLPNARLVRAFNAIGAGRLPAIAGGGPGRVGMPIAGDDAEAIAVASALIRDVGFEPVLAGPLAMGRYLIPGTPLAGEHTPAEIRQIVSTLR